MKQIKPFLVVAFTTLAAGFISEIFVKGSFLVAALSADFGFVIGGVYEAMQSDE